jgi:hypothetical protein
MTHLPSLWQEPIPPSGPAVTPQQRMAWIREWIRPYTRDLALEHLLTQPGDHRLQLESFEAAIAFGFKCKASADEIIMAANAEWDAAIANVTRCLEALRRRLWHMCRARMPEETIIKAADAVTQDFDVFVPDELLMPLLKRIWDAAQVRRGRGPPRYARAA